MDVEPPPTTMIKINHDDKSDKYFIKLKLRRDPTSAMSAFCEFKMTVQQCKSRRVFVFC